MSNDGPIKDCENLPYKEFLKCDSWSRHAIIILKCFNWVLLILVAEADKDNRDKYLIPVTLIES